MADESLSDGPIWDDITTLSGLPFNGSIDIIYGGFPCQDISIAGHGKGLEGKRSGLFFEILRLAKEIVPRWIFLENVPAITSRGGIQVLEELNKVGYNARWCVISAASVGALHKRERWFLLANSPSKSANGHAKREEETYSLLGNGSENVAHANSSGLQETRTEQQTTGIARKGFESKPFVCNTDNIASEQASKLTITELPQGRTRRDNSSECWPFESRDDWQKTVREMGKCSNGVFNHVAKLRALGNSVVPAQVKEAFQILMGIK